ncbi:MULTISPECIES: hypothetical protein [Streptomyces]|uniref:hypothetical protein n=1 Tax=Streptomyces TaxID=1883 RepID=UPI00166F6AB2|nr:MULTISPECIES: hypothetical protein [Streptomyces]UFR06713.1 hypothetical protein KBP30_38515 [Streptomyces sp. Go40/10]GGS54588.1 hypothetical protein GCM10010206_15400 [Streptomyces cinerochromogenes]
MASVGDIATWVGSAGTWVGLGAAIYAGRAAFQLLRLERQRDHEREQDRRSAQASGVAAWTGHRPDTDMITSAAYSVEAAYPDVYLINSSKLPVYDLRLYLWVDFHAGPLLWQIRATVPPTLRPERVSSFLLARVNEAAVMARTTGVSLSFRDAEGNCWQRSRDGLLHQVPLSEHEQRTVRDGGERRAAVLVGDVEPPPLRPGLRRPGDPRTDDTLPGR